MSRPAPNPVPSPISTLPLALWLLVQLEALAISALRIPLAAQYPQPGERWAVRLVLAVQFAWVALVFPSLCRTWSMSLVTAVCGWVMLVLAGGMAAWPPKALIAPASSLTFWIFCLACWRAALPADRWRMIASACASAFAVGGALLWYLGIDLAPGASAPDLRLGPLAGVLYDPSQPRIAQWTGLVALSLAAIGISNLRRLAKTDRNSPSTTAYPPDIHDPPTRKPRIH